MQIADGRRSHVLLPPSGFSEEFNNVQVENIWFKQAEETGNVKGSDKHQVKVYQDFLFFKMYHSNFSHIACLFAADFTTDKIHLPTSLPLQ